MAQKGNIYAQSIFKKKILSISKNNSSQKEENLKKVFFLFLLIAKNFPLSEKKSEKIEDDPLDLYLKNLQTKYQNMKEEKTIEKAEKTLKILFEEKIKKIAESLNTQNIDLTTQFSKKFLQRIAQTIN